VSSKPRRSFTDEQKAALSGAPPRRPDSHATGGHGEPPRPRATAFRSTGPSQRARRYPSIGNGSSACRARASAVTRSQHAVA
jgi:hypothetical protein